MNHRNCVETLAKKYGLKHQEAAALYDDVTQHAKYVAEKEGHAMSGYDMEAEFIRRLDPEKKKKIAEETKNEKARHFLRESARKIATFKAASETTAFVAETMVEAIRRQRDVKSVGGYKNWGKLDPIKAIKARILGDGSGLPNTRRSVARDREAFDSYDYGILISFFQKHPEVRKVFNRANGLLPGNRAKYGPQVAKMTEEAVDMIIAGNLHKVADNAGEDVTSQLAKTIRAMMDSSTTRLSEAGAFIRLSKRYVPNVPDAHKIMQVTEDEFVDFVLDNDIINWERSYLDSDKHHLLVTDVAARRAKLKDLYSVFVDQAADASEEAAEAAGGVGRVGDAAARRFEHQASWQFSSGKAWTLFHEKFGRHKDIMSAATEKVNQQNRLTAMFRAFGPNPAEGFELVKRQVADMIERGEIAMTGEVKADVLKKLRAVDVNAGARVQDGVKIHTLNGMKTLINPKDGGLSMAFSEAAGETLYSANHNAAKVCATIRVTESMAMLGGAVITAMTDVPNVLFANVARGRGWGEATRSYFESVKSYRAIAKGQADDFKEIAPFVSSYLEGLIGHFHSRYTMEEHGTATSRLQNTYFRANFLTQWTDSQRAVAGIMNMEWLGQNAAKSWDELSKLNGGAGKRLQGVLASHGFTPKKWDAVRSGIWTGPDGKTYILPERIDTMDAERLRAILSEESVNPDMPYSVRAAHAAQIESWKKDINLYRRQLKGELVGMLRDEVRFGVIESDERTRYFAMRGTSPGTLTGEVLRFMTQFKAYSIGLADRTWSRALYADKEQGFHMPGLPEAATLDMNIAKWIAMSIGTGYMTQALGDITKGYEPRDMYGEHGWQTFLSAMHKSGAAAIYGDVIADAFSRYDNSWMEKAISMGLGPTGSNVNAILRIASMEDKPMQYVWGGVRSGDKDFAEAFRFMVNNTPYLNLFYIRQALDTAVLYHLEEMFNPGVIKRRQHWNRRELGRDALIRWE